MTATAPFNILAIDPSQRHVGYALVQIENGIASRWVVGSWDLFGTNYLARCMDLVHCTRALLKGKGGIEVIVIEWPTFFDCQRGHVAATQGYTIDLAGIAMFLAGHLQLDHRRIVRYTPAEWKGSVSKGITARRFFRRFNIPTQQQKNIPDHATDAAMMALHYLQRLQIEVSFDQLKLKI